MANENYFVPEEHSSFISIELEVPTFYSEIRFWNYCIFVFWKYEILYEREREREWERKGGRERERERESIFEYFNKNWTSNSKKKTNC